MKILLINNLYKPFNKGGAEIVVEKIADGLVALGHEITIITTKPLFKKILIKDDYKIYRIKIFNIISYFNLRLLPKIFRLFWHLIDMFNFISYLQVKSIITREKPNLIISYNLKGIGFLILLLIKKAGIKHIHCLQDIQLIHPSGLMIYGQEKKIKNFFSKIYIYLNKIIFGSPDIIISPSKWLLELHIKNDFFKNSKKRILLNPIDNLSDIIDGKNNNNIFTYLYVGQIEIHKGLDCLLESYIKLLNNKINSQLIIIGTGSKLNDYRKKNNYKNIIFLGHKNNKEVASFMKKSNILIVPSICYENSPTVIYEAASIGLPVLASNIGGVTELIKIFGGLTFLPNNPGDLTAKMLWSYTNFKALKKISQKKSGDIVKYRVDKYLDVLLSL